MTPITLIILVILFILITDADVKTMLLVSLCFLFSDYLFWSSTNWNYYFRVATQDIILTSLCLWMTLSNKNKGFIWAAIICLISASTMVYEGLHEYQSPIYHYLNTIQFVLMQLYLIALTYKANWRLPCPEQLKSLLLSRNRSERIPTTAQNECQQSDMERW